MTLPPFSPSPPPREERAGVRRPNDYQLKSLHPTLPMNRSAAVCGRGGTSRSGPAGSCALRLVEDDKAALR